MCVYYSDYCEVYYSKTIQQFADGDFQLRIARERQRSIRKHCSGVEAWCFRKKRSRTNPSMTAN